VERIGRSIAWSFEFFTRAVFFPTVQAKTGLTGFALWAAEKSFEQGSLYCVMASFVQMWKGS
jgi:hypothetical protein